MSDKFEASNGGAVEILGNGRMTVTDPSPDPELVATGATSHKTYLDPNQINSLREFFQHEHDQELGRWRDPDSPYLVVYTPNEEGKVRVVDEQAGWGWAISPETKAYSTSTLYDVVKAGHHYFEAHPAPEPWHDAKPGEVWVIEVPTGPTFELAAMTAVEINDEIAFHNPGTDEWLAPNFKARSARRIYPEPSDG